MLEPFPRYTAANVETFVAVWVASCREGSFLRIERTALHTADNFSEAWLTRRLKNDTITHGFYFDACFHIW